VGYRGRAHMWNLPVLHLGRENLMHAPLVHRLGSDGAMPNSPSSTRRYAYRLPTEFSDQEAAPLLCRHHRYRGLLRSNLPAGGRLGIYGSRIRHITAQIASRRARVHVVTRRRRQALARGLSGECRRSRCGASGAARWPAISLAPGTLVPPAWLHSIAEERSPSPVSISAIFRPLNYEKHLFEERTLQSVTANTRLDGESFLALAATDPRARHHHPISDDQADEALRALAHDRVDGAAVLINAEALTAHAPRRGSDVSRRTLLSYLESVVLTRLCEVATAGSAAVAATRGRDGHAFAVGRNGRCASAYTSEPSRSPFRGDVAPTRSSTLLCSRRTAIAFCSASRSIRAHFRIDSGLRLLAKGRLVKHHLHRRGTRTHRFG